VSSIADEGFVDIHSHVLYDLDDGAATIEDSLAMLRIAEAAGTVDLVVTPHANARYRFDPMLVETRIATLQPQTRVRLHPGCDFHLSADNIDDAFAHLTKYTLNRGTYLLVEFHDIQIFRPADDVFRRMLHAGLIPVISHPERNVHLRRGVGDLERWVARGCVLQITAASLVGLFGREAQHSAHDLVARGLAHIVASDAHDVKHRTPDLRAAYRHLCERWTESSVRRLFVDNPRAVLSSEPIDRRRLRRRGWRGWLSHRR
jgi:protein-tyrosine phosphatase